MTEFNRSKQRKQRAEISLPDLCCLCFLLCICIGYGCAVNHLRDNPPWVNDPVERGRDGHIVNPKPIAQVIPYYDGPVEDLAGSYHDSGQAPGGTVQAVQEIPGEYYDPSIFPPDNDPIELTNWWYDGMPEIERRPSGPN